jgi:cytochrome P450
MRRDPIDALMAIARDFGDVAYTRLGPFDIYLVSHPDDIRDVLVTNNHAFMKGRGLQEARRVLGDGLLTSEGVHHRRQRRLIQPIFHHSRIDEYGAVMVEEAERASNSWKDGARMDVHAEMTRLTLLIVGRTLFDADLAGDAAGVRQALAQVLQIFERVSSPLGPLLDRLPLPSTRRFERARRDLDAVIGRMISERRAAAARGEPPGRDVLSLLIAAQDHDSGDAMTDQQVRDEAMTLFLAGHETTAQLMTWIWYLLSRNPEAAGTLHEELDRVMGDRPPTVQDIPHLPFTEMVLTEAMRLYPPAYVLGRLALEDVSIREYRVPAGSTVLVSPYVVHHDPRWYPEPFRFDPSRWANDGASSRPRQTFIPFGGGPRVCIGEGFAWMEAKLLLATIARRWEVRVDPNRPVALQPMVTLRPRGGMPAVVTRRRPASTPRATSKASR